MKLSDINENSIPTPDEAGERVKNLLAKHKGKPGLPANPNNDHAKNTYHADQARAEQQQRDDRATANEEQLTELDKSKYQDWAAASNAWRNKQPMDFKDPAATNKAERRAEREMNIRNKHGVKHTPVTSEISEISKNLRDKYVDRAVTAHGHYNMARRNTQGEEQSEWARKEQNSKNGISRALSDERIKKDREDAAKEVDEGRFVKGPGGVPLDRNGQPKVATQRAAYSNRPAVQRDNNRPYNSDDPAIADFVAKGGNVKVGAYNGPRKSEEPGFGSRHIGGVRDAMSGKSGRTLGHGANTNFKGDSSKPVVASEGGMGGINRAAPSNDVSYEKTLDDVKDTWRGQTVQVNELDDKNGTLRQAAANRPLPPNGQGGIMRSGQQSVNIKTGLDKREQDAAELRRRQAMGDPRVQESTESSYAARLSEFVELSLNEVSKERVLKPYIKASSRDMSDRASGEGYKAAKKNADKPYNTADETHKEKKRQQGIDRATDKLADTEYGKKLKEFVEKIMK